MQPIGIAFSQAQDGFRGAAMTGRRGFTILEIVAVLLLLSILATVAGTRFSTSAIELQATVDRLKGHIRYAQSRAMNSETHWGINLPGDRYSLFNNDNVANIVRLPGEKEDEIALPSGYAVTAGTLVFDTWGTPFTDAAAAAANKQSVTRAFTVTAPSGESAQISIEPNTGFVR